MVGNVRAYPVHRAGYLEHCNDDNFGAGGLAA